MKWMMLFWMLVAGAAGAQNVPGGIWQLTDSKSGKALVHLRFEKSNGGLRAVIVAIPKESAFAKTTKCTTCPARDSRHNQPLMGMEILSGLQPAGANWVQGSWLDLEKGFTYMANLSMPKANEIRVSVMYGKMERAKILTPVR